MSSNLFLLWCPSSQQMVTPSEVNWLLILKQVHLLSLFVTIPTPHHSLSRHLHQAACSNNFSEVSTTSSNLTASMAQIYWEPSTFFQFPPQRTQAPWPDLPDPPRMVFLHFFPFLWLTLLWSYLKILNSFPPQTSFFINGSIFYDVFFSSSLGQFLLVVSSC